VLLKTKVARPQALVRPGFGVPHVKKTILSISGALGIHRLYASLNRHHPIVLTFHGVTAEAPGNLCNEDALHLHLPIFARLMEHVARQYNVVSLSRIVDWLEGRAGAPERAVAITFDDGYRNVLTNAAPVLNRLGIPATLFVVTDYVFHGRMLWPDRVTAALALTSRPELTVPWSDGVQLFSLQERAQRLDAMRRIVARCKAMPGTARVALVDRIVESLGLAGADLFSAWDDLRPLDPDEMKRLPDLGVEIGSHTCSHPIVTQLDTAAVKRELVESKRAIEACLGRPCVDFAYPNGGAGDFDARTRREVIEAGYRCALTTIKTRVSRETEVFEIPRCTFTHNRITVPEFAAQVSGLPEAFRAAKRRLSSGAAGRA